MFGGGQTGGRPDEDEAARDACVDRAPAPPADGAPVTAAYSTVQPPNRFYIPASWPLIAPVMAAAMLPAVVSARALPGPIALGSAVLAILIGALARERGRAWPAALTIIFAIALPMSLYGFAAAVWARAHGEPLWAGAVGMAALASGAAALLLVRRLTALFVALVTVWLPLALASASGEAGLIFAFGIGGGSLLLARQARSEAQRRQRRRVQERAFDILVDYERTGHGWFWETDRDGRITYLSASLGDAFGCAVEDLHGRPFVDLFVRDVTGSEGAATGLGFHFSAWVGFSDVLVSLAAQGEERWSSISGTPIQDRRGAYFGFRGFGWDQTEKRRWQERTSRLAHYDSLTGLANRVQMAQSLEMILSAPRQEHRRCAVLLIDLDRFKQVNDTLGHPAGDELLRQVAERLRAAIDRTGRVGRLGGDEFQVILPGGRRREDLSTLADEIVSSLTRPYTLDGQRAVIGASVGIAIAPEDGVTPKTLIRNADLALYAAKAAGRGRHRFYVPDLHSDAEERRQLERDLREAVASGGLELWYQPVIHTLTERIAGFEALLRWTHPRLGRLSPAKFVPIAEEAGLIAQIGEWTLRTACRDLAGWPEDLRVAVNLSPLQFANPALPAIVTSALASAQVAPSRLELEITESVFLNEEGPTDAIFAALKGIGVRLALDDFGTGYSSLAHLEAAPFDRIKIDRSFMLGAMTPGSRNSAILASIIDLAETFGMDTTVEGVETQEELDLVRLLGCSHVQGYFYDAPIDLDTALDRLREPFSARCAAQG